MACISMEDDLGITYIIETPSQFWSELEDMVHFQSKSIPTLSFLDSALQRLLIFCSNYHEQYLQSPLQLEHACELILDSELFEFHSERMSEILVNDVQKRTDPHLQLMIYHVLLFFGRRRPEFLRSRKRWQPLLHFLLVHVLVEIDPDVQDTYFGAPCDLRGHIYVPVPIEAKLRSVSVKLLYDVCRVQQLTMQDLRVFDDFFLDYLFELTEQTRHMHDETFNYSIIKLIVCLNEQFMVATLRDGESTNRVLDVLMRRLGSSKTFGENMIFMLNRAGRTPEDLCMQVLILKLIYVLFTSKGASEYFYTNDLRVLVDVFLRELLNLDEESESLRHTYLRVLYPLLTRTQLRNVPYKRTEIAIALESLVANSQVRDVNPTTKRLVERCLTGDWCVNVTKARRGSSVMSTSPDGGDNDHPRSPTSLDYQAPAASQLGRTNSKKLKSSKSVELLKYDAGAPKSSSVPHLRRRPSNSSLPKISAIPSTNSMPISIDDIKPAELTSGFRRRNKLSLPPEKQNEVKSAILIRRTAPPPPLRSSSRRLESMTT